MKTRHLPLLLVFVAACGSENQIYEPPPPPPEPPPPEEIDAQGRPPANWDDCGSGHYGLYFNLPADHPDLELAGDTDPQVVQPDLGDADYYTTEYLTFSRYDPSIDWGTNWWPVDSGLEDDPAYFAVQYTSWLRVWSGGTLQFMVAAEDDIRIEIDGEVRYELSDAPYRPEMVNIDMPAGQFPVEIRYAHRLGSTDGFRFRLASGDAKICWPYFPPPEEETED